MVRMKWMLLDKCVVWWMLLDKCQLGYGCFWSMLDPSLQFINKM